MTFFTCRAETSFKNRKAFGLLIICCFFSFSAFAQRYITGPGISALGSSPQPVCPGTPQYYQTASNDGCTYTWTAVGYSSINQLGATCMVVWSDSPNTPAHTIQVTTRDCSTATNSTVSSTYSIDIATLSGVQLTPIRLSQNGNVVTSIPALDASVVTLCINPVSYVGWRNFPSEQVSLYEWTIPSGWRWDNINGPLSDGTPRQFSSINAYCIMVFPDVNGGDATVSVRALNNRCSGALPSTISSRPVVRPRPQVQLSASSQTVSCGRGVQPAVTASMTMAGGVVTYQWTIPNQQAAAPAPAGTAVLNIFNLGLMSAALLNGVVTTGVLGTATLRCTASVRAIAFGPVLYTSVQDFVVTVAPALVQPVVTPATVPALCTTTETRQLTGSAPGAQTMKWWTTDGSLRFTSATDPVGKVGTAADPFVATTTGSGGNSTVMVASVGTINGLRPIRLQAFNDAKWCTPSQVTAYAVLYGVTLEPASASISFNPNDPCNAVYDIVLPPIAGATGYTWAIYPTYGYQIGGYTATITGSPWTGTNQPNPPSWRMTPINQASPSNPYGTRATLIVGINYQGENSCGTGEYGGGSYNLFLRAVSGPCPYRPAPPVTVEPVPADDVLHIGWEQEAAAEGAAKASPVTQVQVLDVYGHIWHTQLAEATGTTLDLRTAHLPAGPYLLRIRRGETVETRRIAVQH